MKIYNFNDFLLEGNLLNSLYHFTDSYALVNILNNNMLNISNTYDIIYKGGYLKSLSLTRNKNLIDPMRESPIRIELDLFSIKYNNKVIPYDFFIHSSKETKLKGELDRKTPFEYEEMLTKSINNLNKCIISIDFKDYYNFRKCLTYITLYMKKYKPIDISINNKIINNII